MLYNNALLFYLFLDVTVAADSAMKALRRMKDGLAGTTKKRARDEMTSLLRGKGKRQNKVAWRHKFVCWPFIINRGCL